MRKYITRYVSAVPAVVLWLGLWFLYRFAGLDWFVFVASLILVLSFIREKGLSNGAKI